MGLDLEWEEKVEEKLLPEEEPREEKKYLLKLIPSKWSNLRA